MAYDPDGDPDDLDPEHVEDVAAFLNDPGNVRMGDSMRRSAQALPAAERLRELRRRLTEAVAWRDEIAWILAEDGDREDDDRRVLLAACTAEVDDIENRIVELSGPVPDHP